MMKPKYNKEDKSDQLESFSWEEWERSSTKNPTTVLLSL